ncbi:MAG TPA: hypothetical protein VK191_12865 [Symbiobacteriaceae bacterium]|nr:hypothetical protein [Symbiobacteriaceae bacterium]
MSRFVGTALVILGVFLAVTFLVKSAWLFVLLALLFGVGASTGLVGRWGMGVAGVLLLIALPGLFFGAVGTLLHLAIRFAPLLLVIWGISMLMGKGKRRW